MACGWHHCGPCWDWNWRPYPPPPVPRWRSESPADEEVAMLREYLRRLEAEIAHVRQRLDEVARG